MVTLLLLLLTGCNIATGTGTVIEESRDVSGFDRVVLATSGELTLTQDDNETLTIQADNNLLPLIVTEVRNGTLYIETKENTLIQSRSPIRYTLSAREVVGIETSGSGAIRAAALNGNALEVVVAGSGEVLIDELHADSIAVAVSGSGDASLTGTVSEQHVLVEGSGSYEAGDLATKRAAVEVSGSGDATVWVTEMLSLDVSGSGDVQYYGDPAVTLGGSASEDITRLGSR
jgi:hypothetical protein